MMIFLLGSSFGILKVYGGARRNHRGAGRSCPFQIQALGPISDGPNSPSIYMGCVFYLHSFLWANSSCTRSILICIHHFFLNPKLSLSSFRIWNEKKKNLLDFSIQKILLCYGRKIHLSFGFIYLKLSYLCCGYKYPEK